MVSEMGLYFALTEAERIGFLSFAGVIVTAGASLTAAVLAHRVRKENADQHGTSQEKLGTLADKIDEHGAKVDDLKNDVQHIAKRVDHAHTRIDMTHERIDRRSNTVDL
jgi:hypothetical protein